MKRLLMLLVLPLTLLTCKKEETFFRPFPHWGGVTATVNGEPWLTFMINPIPNRSWSMKIYGAEGPCNDSTFSILIYRFSPQGVMREGLSFAEIPARTGTYRLDGKPEGCNSTDLRPNAFFSTTEGDALLDIYRVLPAEPHTLTVTSYSPVTEEIKGSFQVTMVVEHKSPYSPGYPDTIWVSGEFHTKIIQHRE